MSKVIAWYRLHEYKWLRKEYLRVFNICNIIALPILFVGLGLGVILQDYSGAAMSIGIVTAVILGLCLGVMFTLRQVDEHEKKVFRGKMQF